MKADIDVQNISEFAIRNKDTYKYLVAKRINGVWWYHGVFDTRAGADECVVELEEKYNTFAVVCYEES